MFLKEKKMMQQVDTYLHWINNQLEKRANSRKITDLTKDMRDGVAYLQLVEIISHKKQAIIDEPSLTLSDMRTNIASVLEFLSKNNIRVHHIMPKEIMEGSLKSTMRLILALAAHFKPDSFKYHVLQSTPNTANKGKLNLQKTTSLISLASDAAASLAEASKNATNSGMSFHYKHRNRSRLPKHTSKPNRPLSSISLSLPSKKSLRLENNEIPDISQSATRLCHPRNESIDSLSSNHAPTGRSSQSTTDIHYEKVRRNIISDDDCSVDDCLENEILLEQQENMLQELDSTKDVLLQLQQLLLSGSTKDEQLGYDWPKDESFQEQLIMKNILFEQTVEECNDLKSHVNELKEINMAWSGERTALEMRVSQQEQLILSLKSKVLKYEISKKTPNEQDLEALLNERDKELDILHEELAKRDGIIHKQKEEIDSMSNNIVTKKRAEANLYAKLESSESLVSSLRMQVQELTERMHSVSLNEKSYHSYSSSDSATNKISEGKFLREKQKITREYGNMKMTLSNIRCHFKSDDPVQHAFESLEHSMMSLLDSVTMIEKNMHSKESRPLSSIPPRSYPFNIKSPTSSDSGIDYNGNSSLESGELVKIVYFLGKSITPILKTTDVGLGFFTLRDFKQIVKRPGSYRYFFKALDKDFGFVREELLFDDDIIPGHESKIVAWLEKQIGEDV